MFLRRRKIRQFISFLFLSIITVILLKISLNQRFEDSSYFISNIDEFPDLCLDMEYYLEKEKSLPLSPLISAPSFNSGKLLRLPYRYSQWKSSLIYPRLFTPCEHSLVMNLLIIIDEICREQNITYFITAGTLIGSLRHHDIIPWDDDVDIMIPYYQRKLFSSTFKRLNHVLIQLFLVHGDTKEENYYKMFYKNDPNAGEKGWHFPFIDIYFYIRNKTHLWCLADSNLKIPIKYIFPLILRPLGQLWIPTPRKPQEFLQMNPFNQCLSRSWDQRNEIEIKQRKIQCSQLNDIYPFVERINQYNQYNAMEILKINNTIIHTIIFQ